MISPFAMYFYAVYGPILEFFSSTPLLSWTTEFFLPHMVFLDDPFVLGLSYLQSLMVIGLALFLSAAIPLYYGRFTKKGVVQMSFYAKIRHPQYLFLGISGFGMLLYWPRFIILVMYVTMLFVYYLLARHEEWRMQREAPEAYKKYMANTSMFLPGEPGGKIYALFFGWIQPKWFGFLVTYVITVALAVSLAMGIRAYTINHLPVFSEGELVFLPVFPRSKSDVQKLQKVLQESKEARVAINELQPNLAYIFPGDFFLTAIVTDQDRRWFPDDPISKRIPEFFEWHQHKFRGGLGSFFRIFYNFFKTLNKPETNYDIERLVFMKVTDGDQPVSSEDLFKIGLQRKPVLVIDIDPYEYQIISVIKTSGFHKWGITPMPSF
ncbi:MAG: hypothetical protein KKB30_16480 [Proteobacteria bacterium]|nr:hypothetical protein [Pseudomonadota bacterium]MBU1716641.1 hypothetical protein [Pseudomonadota bacterium]